jgi:hypothetical protein
MSPSEVRAVCAQFTGRVYVQKQRLNGGGYTSDGIYFGIGDPLYFAQDEEGLWADYFRASCRDEAIEILRDRYPIAKIKR